jgi:hypothetical protein
MKKLLILLTLILSACSSNTASIQTTIQTAVEEGAKFIEVESCDAMIEDIEKQAVQLNLHPQQIMHCYSLADLSIAFVEQPNTWTALHNVREWEKEGNIAWGGLIIKPMGGTWENFLKIDEDFNPINLFTTKDSLILDTSDDSGAGSGEGTLQRYSYPAAGVAEENLFQWTKEKCTSYYIPETYNSETACN